MNEAIRKFPSDKLLLKSFPLEVFVICTTVDYMHKNVYKALPSHITKSCISETHMKRRL